MYWRWADGSGPGYEEQRQVWARDDFHQKLLSWRTNLYSYGMNYGNYGGLVHIVTAGVGYTLSSGSRHRQGTAFDLDRVRWQYAKCTPYMHEHASSSRKVRRRYLGVDAICRKWFRWSLNGNYNADHQDHIHFDFGGMPPRLQTSSLSDTVFIQQVCNDFMGYNLALDRIWGPLTNAAYLELKQRLDVNGNPMTSTTAYRKLLLGIIRNAFADRTIT